MRDAPHTHPHLPTHTHTPTNPHTHPHTNPHPPTNTRTHHTHTHTTGQPFDFTKVYSYGEARHKYYSGRRLWRALSLFKPSLHLSPDYEDLVLEPAYPFSVIPDAAVDRQTLCAMLRDYFQVFFLRNDFFLGLGVDWCAASVCDAPGLDSRFAIVL